MAAKFSVTLPATAIFDYPSPIILANAIGSLMGPSCFEAQILVPRPIASPENSSRTLAVRAICSRFPSKGKNDHESIPGHMLVILQVVDKEISSIWYHQAQAELSN